MDQQLPPQQGVVPHPFPRPVESSYLRAEIWRATS